LKAARYYISAAACFLPGFIRALACCTDAVGCFATGAGLVALGRFCGTGFATGGGGGAGVAGFVDGKLTTGGMIVDDGTQPELSNAAEETSATNRVWYRVLFFIISTETLLKRILLVVCHYRRAL